MTTKLSDRGTFDGETMTLKEAFIRNLVTISTGKMETHKRQGQRHRRQVYWLDCIDGSGSFEIGKLAYMSLTNQKNQF